MSLADTLSPPRSGGLLAALHLWQRLVLIGPAAIRRSLLSWHPALARPSSSYPTAWSGSTAASKRGSTSTPRRATWWESKCSRPTTRTPARFTSAIFARSTADACRIVGSIRHGDEPFADLHDQQYEWPSTIDPVGRRRRGSTLGSHAMPRPRSPAGYFSLERSSVAVLSAASGAGRRLAGRRRPRRAGRRWQRSTAPAGFADSKPTRAGCSFPPTATCSRPGATCSIADDVTVVLDDGRRFTAKLLGADPLTEIAVLKFDAGAGTAAALRSGASRRRPTSAPVSWRSATCSASPRATSRSACCKDLSRPWRRSKARRGGFSDELPRRRVHRRRRHQQSRRLGRCTGRRQGRLLGMLGKELRSELTGTWLNYALPVEAFASTAERHRVWRVHAAAAHRRRSARASARARRSGHRAGAGRGHPHATVRRPRRARFARCQGGAAAGRSARDDRLAGGHLASTGRRDRRTV